MADLSSSMPHFSLADIGTTAATPNKFFSAFTLISWLRRFNRSIIFNAIWVCVKYLNSFWKNKDKYNHKYYNHYLKRIKILSLKYTIRFFFCFMEMFKSLPSSRAEIDVSQPKKFLAPPPANVVLPTRNPSVHSPGLQRGARLQCTEIIMCFRPVEQT